MEAITTFRRVKFHFDNVHFKVPLEFGPYCLVQAGDLATEADYVCEPHMQSVYEISYVVSGEGVFFVDDASYPVRKDMLFVNRPGEKHAIRSNKSNPIRYFYLGFTFNDAFLSKYEYKTLKDFFDATEMRIAVAGSSLQDSFLKLFNNLITTDLFANSMIESCIHQIAVTVYRQYNGAAERVYAPTQPLDGKKRLLYDIIHYIDVESEDMGALQKLSETFGYSYSYIADLFSRNMGESLKEYFTRRRFERATQLLEDGMSVTQIADMLGYKSIHSFSRAFTRRFGVSPLEYRKAQRESLGKIPTKKERRE